jgi:hypothetical protein
MEGSQKAEVNKRIKTAVRSTFCGIEQSIPDFV